MIVLRVAAQILIAAAVMVLGYDALSAMEAGAIDPIRFGQFVDLFAQQWGIAEGLTTERLMTVAEAWPQFMRAAYIFIIAAPTFFVLGVIGVAGALMFRSRA